MNLNNQFPNQTDRDGAIAILRSLSNNSDWIFLRDNIIQVQLNEVTNDILSKKFDNLDDLNNAQLRRDYLLMFINYPLAAIHMLEQGDGEPVDDPYYQNIEEKTKMAR